MTTTNGTRAILASHEADRVLIAAFPNACATAAACDPPTASTRGIHLVCAGTDGRISFEDSALAGRLVGLLATFGSDPGNDEAEIVGRMWLEIEHGKNRDMSLDAILSRGRGGRRVTEIGLAADIKDAATIDRFDFVAELRRDPWRIVRV